MSAGWDDFAARLGAALREVGERVRVIVASDASPSHFVQFAGFADKLVVETPPARLAPETDESVLAAAGWAAPAAAQENWSIETPLPALTDEYAAVAERCVVALRDALRVAGPDALVYTAWRDAERMPEGVTLSDEQVDALDQGENPLEVPELGLPAERAA
ncbi:MAG: TY-Chap domain-containing protein [Microbacterium sp.]